MSGNSKHSLGVSAPKKPEIIFTYPGADAQSGAAVYTGTVPHSASSNNKPVVVFVPGLGKSAPFFWSDNSMYVGAYYSGFRTAFVSFIKPDNPPQDMWKNGEILARQLADICAHYHVPRVVIVAHSKGGVDSQTAAVYFGAAKNIERIVTLSSPHFGSQLADIAYSSAGWTFAELIKAHSPGCFAMQTGFMQEFRNITDKNVHNVTPIATFAGNGGADALTRMRASSLLLDRYGENDGVVTVASAHNPKGEHLGTFHFNHAQMGSGNFIWPHIEPVLSGTAAETVTSEPAIAAFATADAAADAAPSTCRAEPAHIIKGGSLEKGIDEGFCVDSTVESFTAAIMLAGSTQQGHFLLTAPDGNKTVLVAKRDPDSVITLRTDVKKPQVGKWRLTASRGKGAYCALISLSGSNTFCTCPKDAEPGRIDAELRILRTYPDSYDVVGEYSFKNGVPLPEPPKFSNGIYNLEMRLSGELDDGSTYERSLIRPIATGSDICETLRLTGNH